MRRPTPREWRLLWEPLAWLILLPTIAATLGNGVAAVAAGTGLVVHLVAYLRAVQPGAADDEETAPADLLTPVEGRLRRLARGVGESPELVRTIVVVVALSGRALAGQYGEWVFLVMMLVAATVVGGLEALATDDAWLDPDDEPDAAAGGDRVS